MSVVAGKSEVLASMRKIRLEAFEISDLKARVYGLAGITVGSSAISGSYQDEGSVFDISGKFRFTRLYVRADGEWRMVAAHVSEMVAE